jgi:hypothetical protein
VQTDPTIKLAVRILGAGAQEDIEKAIERLSYESEFSLRNSKKGKVAARRLADALKKVERAAKDDNLWYALKPDWFITHDKLLRWIEICNVTADRPLDRHHQNYNGEFRPGAYEKKAAELAYELLQKYERPISATKESQFEKLAAALAGRPKANFHHYCRSVLSAKTGAK